MMEGSNLYTYVYHNPVVLVDPSGLLAIYNSGNVFANCPGLAQVLSSLNNILSNDKWWQAKCPNLTNVPDLKAVFDNPKTGLGYTTTTTAYIPLIGNVPFNAVTMSAANGVKMIAINSNFCKLTEQEKIKVLIAELTHVWQLNNLPIYTKPYWEAQADKMASCL